MPGIRDRGGAIALGLAGVRHTVLRYTQADQVAAAHIQAQLKRTSQGFARGGLSLFRSRGFLDLAHAQPIADGLDQDLIVSEIWIWIAPRYACIRHRQQHFFATFVIPMNVAADRFGIVHGRPDTRDGVFHPEVQIRLVPRATVPDGGLEAIAIGHDGGNLIPQANVGVQPGPQTDVWQDHRAEFDQCRAYFGH